MNSSLDLEDGWRCCPAPIPFLNNPETQQNVTDSARCHEQTRRLIQTEEHDSLL